jgi:hypothetical protein
MNSDYYMGPKLLKKTITMKSNDSKYMQDLDISI